MTKSKPISTARLMTAQRKEYEDGFDRAVAATGEGPHAFQLDGRQLLTLQCLVERQIDVIKSWGKTAANRRDIADLVAVQNIIGKSKPFE